MASCVLCGAFYHGSTCTCHLLPPLKSSHSKFHCDSRIAKPKVSSKFEYEERFSYERKKDDIILEGIGLWALRRVKLLVPEISLRQIITRKHVLNTRVYIHISCALLLRRSPPAPVSGTTYHVTLFGLVCATRVMRGPLHLTGAGASQVCSCVDGKIGEGGKWLKILLWDCCLQRAVHNRKVGYTLRLVESSD